MNHQLRPLADRLARYARRFPEEIAIVERFRYLLTGYPDCCERDCWPGHLTASAWLVDPAGREVLLTHHRKLGAWLQLGGHCDGNPDTAAVAVLEAEEESGLEVELLWPEILDLDVHAIPPRGADPAHDHFDVRYALVSRSGRAYRVSEESHDLAWVGLDALDRYTREPSLHRMAEKFARLRAQLPLD
jgi:8-oxo-dGTP pyrophosphatase MutT (NUDIX family)